MACIGRPVLTQAGLSQLNHQPATRPATALSVLLPSHHSPCTCILAASPGTLLHFCALNHNHSMQLFDREFVRSTIPAEGSLLKRSAGAPPPQWTASPTGSGGPAQLAERQPAGWLGTCGLARRPPGFNRVRLPTPALVLALFMYSLSPCQCPCRTPHYPG